MSTPVAAHTPKCFACDRPLKGKASMIAIVGEDPQYTYPVGPDCFNKIANAGADGYQPPLGGPRLRVPQS